MGWNRSNIGHNSKSATCANSVRSRLQRRCSSIWHLSRPSAKSLTIHDRDLCASGCMILRLAKLLDGDRHLATKPDLTQIESGIGALDLVDQVAAIISHDDPGWRDLKNEMVCIGSFRELGLKLVGCRASRSHDLTR